MGVSAKSEQFLSHYFWFCLVVVEARNRGYYKRGCEKINYQNPLISERCPLNIEWDANIEGEGFKKCWCDTNEDTFKPCNGGPLSNRHPGYPRCIDYIKCETTEDCGEGGYCERTW